MTFTPHTPQNISEMLQSIDVKNINDLFDEIPKSIPKASLNTLSEGLNEMELLKHAEVLANKIPSLCCFVGAGCYDHHIPAAVWDIATRGEFLTSYTPYQAEVSQGTLQILYEFQTMISELYGLDVANASLYDGATALAESILMARRIQKTHPGNTVLIPPTLHPHHKDVLQTILHHQDIKIKEMPFDKKSGTTDLNALSDDPKVFAIVITQINFFGMLEPVDSLTNFAKNNQAIAIGYANPLFLSLLKAPGQWGANGVDIACGEGQPLGIPMASGGPFLGLLTCKKEYVRQMPGRLIGRTTDTRNQEGFALTLQAREQHIRRGKATSNICTNVGLNVTAATIHMSLMGPEGLKRTCLAAIKNMHFLVNELEKIPGVKKVFNGTFVHEAALNFPIPASIILKHLANHQILAGLDLGTYDKNLCHALLICVTEKRSREEIHAYISAVKECIQIHSIKSQGVQHVDI